MKLGVMQPYFLPYIGYFQLLNCVDQFVFFDDVNYIKKGWINRNQLLINGEASMFTIPLKKASQNRKINEIEVSLDQDWLSSFNKKLELSYRNAPYFNEGFKLIQRIFSNYKVDDGMIISDLAINSIKVVLEYLKIDKTFILSSKLEYDRIGNGESKILSICKILDAQAYINPFNGRHLYDLKEFNNCKIDLSFIKLKGDIIYNQNGNNFIPNLSIIDVIMFNSPELIKDYFNQYQLVKE